MEKGFTNENEIIDYLNGRYLIDCDSIWKWRMKKMFPTIRNRDALIVDKMECHEKADISIRVRDEIRYVSIKSGKHNSIHQEEVISFMKFLCEAGLERKYVRELLLYHYGDGTVNNTGEKRYNAEYIKVKYAERIKVLNQFLNEDKILEKVLNRVLFTGNDKIPVDYIYFGDKNTGILLSKKEVLDYLMTNKSMHVESPHFSSLIYQPYGRNQYREGNEEKRLFTQIKWPGMFMDFKKIIR